MSFVSMNYYGQIIITTTVIQNCKDESEIHRFGERPLCFVNSMGSENPK